ncbi:integrin beta-2-like isoform X1 [Acipenser ruthenus]|uniref:integrin beta-2-like isoform X1 n=1 Tax=Acipenser ruthenus TaxID=7906 RepID=UPI00274279AA|nr:integrin beta-2-like isoform X1 [Acipenser ruthenus]XP_058888028.1 integrin beta-2-like isoform X1 [Acipenser ruthenus]
MIPYLSFLLLSLVLLDREVVLSQECTKINVNTCKDCITSGAFCAWCKQKNFTNKGEQDSARCDTKEELEKRGCTETNIINPSSIFTPTVDIPLRSGNQPIQLAPQQIHLELRPGKPTTFPVRFKRAEGYPVDLYYLMDLSYSMNDDLKKVKDLGTDILKALKEITPYARIGFGSFVDKTVLPYTDSRPEKLKKPCPDAEQYCQAAFGYQHVLSLTDDGSRFQQEVSAQFISGNLDSPEGGLDAMMQAAVCGDKIGWGNNTRLLVYTSDAGFHFAGDGKLGSILTPNDGKCHLEGNRYTKSNELDYPSVGELAVKLAENNIQPIFAVTSDMKSVYKELSDMIPKSAVGELATDSSNVVTLIKDAYSNLSSTVIMEHNNLPDGVTISYISNCADKTKTNEPKRSCSNVKINQEISFDVTVTAERCMEPQSFEIRPLGFTEKLTVKIITPCQCDCDDQRDPADCNTNGHIECGICSCGPGHVGQNCEYRVGDKTEKELNQGCKRDNGTSICSNLGDCVCGVCQCHASETPGKQIYGTFCECDNMNCELNNGKLCGGHGKCDCGKCICEENYQGSACQCLRSDEVCKNANGTVCSGRGQCECNVCKCKPGYQPPFCGECPACPSPCPKYATCIECLAFGTGPHHRNCSESCSTIRPIIVDRLVDINVCKEKDFKDCWMFFSMKEMDGENVYEAQISKEQECPNILSAEFLAGVIAGGVLLGGLVVLFLWRGVVEVLDRTQKYHIASVTQMNIREQPEKECFTRRESFSKRSTN